MKQRSPNPVGIIAKNGGVYLMRAKAKFQAIHKPDYSWLLLLGFFLSKSIALNSKIIQSNDMTAEITCCRLTRCGFIRGRLKGPEAFISMQNKISSKLLCDEPWLKLNVSYLYSPCPLPPPLWGHSNPWYTFRHHSHCWSFCMFSTPLILFYLGFLMQETEGWILSLLTSAQQFCIQISCFSLGTRAWILMHCKSNPLFPFSHPSPGPLFCILFCDTSFNF